MFNLSQGCWGWWLTWHNIGAWSVVTGVVGLNILSRYHLKDFKIPPVTYDTSHLMGPIRIQIKKCVRSLTQWRSVIRHPLIFSSPHWGNVCLEMVLSLTAGDNTRARVKMGSTNRDELDFYICFDSLLLWPRVHKYIHLWCICQWQMTNASNQDLELNLIMLKSINNCWLTVNRVETDQISPNIQTSLAHIFDLLIALVKFPWEPLQYSTVVSIK